MKKGQILTHAIVISFGVVLLIATLVIINNAKNNYKDFVSVQEKEKLCLMIKAGIHNIYYPGAEKYYSSLDVSLPESIAGSNYKIRLYGNSIEIDVNDEITLCNTGINVTLKGSSNGGLTQISYTKDESEFIEMKKL